MKRRSPRRLAVVLAALLALLAVVLAAAWQLTPRPARTLTLQVTSARGSSIPVTLTLPGRTGGGVPLVICCHGFTGNRGLDGHYDPLAQRLAEAGVATAALDFAGNGESTEPFTAYTLDSMTADLAAVRAALTADYPVDAERVGLLGHSMGGRLVALNLDETVAAAALWSPAAAPGLDGLEFLNHDAAGREELRTAAESAGTVDLPRWGVTISLDFITQMADSDPWAALTGYQGPLLVAFAAGDVDLLSQGTIDGTRAAADARGADWLDLYGQYEDATHNYTGLTAENDAAVRERIETQTAEFFIEALG